MVRRRIQTVRAPRAYAVPPADMTGLEWTTAQGQASRADSRVFDVRKYGPVGAANDAAIFQAAIDAAFAAGGGVVVSNRPAHTFLTGLTLKDGVYLQFNGSGATHLDFSGVTAPVNGCAIHGGGSLTALPALASNIALNGLSITFASAPGVVAGDVLVIYNSANGSFNPARTYYRAGEFVRVKSVSDNTVALTTRTYAEYASGSTVTVNKVNPVRTGISGARMTFKTGATGIKVVLATNPVFSDLILRGSDWANLNIQQCYNVALHGIDAWDNNPNVGLNYGVMIGNSQNVYLADCFLETTRHGLTTGGGDYVGCVPVRNLTVQGGRISGLETTGNTMGCDMHGNIEHASFVDVDMPHGCMIAGDHTSIKGGRVRSGPDGHAIVLREPIGWNHEINTTIEVTANLVQLSKGAIDLGTTDTANITRMDGLVRVSGVLDMKNYQAASATTLGLHIFNSSLVAANDIHVDLDVLTSNPVYAVNALAAWIRSVNGSGFRFVDISIRAAKMGVQIGCSPQVLHVHGCSLADATNHGILTTIITSPAYPNPLIRSHDNYVTRAGLAGIWYRVASATAGRVESDNDEATNCNRLGTGTTQTGSSIFFQDAKTVIYRRAIVGDDQAVPTQVRRDAVSNVALLIEEDVIDIGTVATRNIAMVTTHHYRGRGAGAPAFVAAVGSEYTRTDGSVSTTKYLNETGTSTWRAI